MNSNKKPNHSYCVIGLGRFGTALAETLAENGQEVLVLDSSESKIRDIQDKVQQALVAPNMDKTAMEEAGVQNCDTVIVAIGENVEASILTTLNVIELGVNRVIAKAVTAQHGRVLQKIGAEVVYPERDRAVRLANALIRPRAMDYLILSDEYAMSEVLLSDKLDGVSIRQADLRKRFSLNIVAILRGQQTIVEFTPDFVLSENDYLLVVGTKDNVTRFEKHMG